VSGLPVDVPPDATELVVEGPRPFVTRVRHRRADGGVMQWEARARRKAAGAGGFGTTWWAGLFFAIGSACFVVGPIPAYAQAVGGYGDALTYFGGSLFFTSGAYLSYLQVVRPAGHRWFARARAVRGSGRCDPDGRHALLQCHHVRRPSRRTARPGEPHRLVPGRDRLGVLPGIVGDRVRGGRAPLVVMAARPRSAPMSPPPASSPTSNWPTAAPSSAPSASSPPPH
jgi:hypothetical protein